MRAARRTRRDDRGAALVEFVLVLPFFLFLIFLMIQFGIMFSFRQEISQAAGEGARAAAIAPVNTTEAQRKELAYKAVSNAMAAQGGMTCTNGTLTKSGTTVGSCNATIAACPGDTSHQCISVKVVHRYREHPVVDVPVFFGATNPQTLSYTASARIS